MFSRGGRGARQLEFRTLRLAERLAGVLLSYGDVLTELTRQVTPLFRFVYRVTVSSTFPADAGRRAQVLVQLDGDPKPLKDELRETNRA